MKNWLSKVNNKLLESTPLAKILKLYYY
jgi:hypothetical protein